MNPSASDARVLDPAQTAAALPWPATGLFIALALVASDLLLTWLGTNPGLLQTTYRMLVWTILCASVALLLLPPLALVMDSRRRIKVCPKQDDVWLYLIPSVYTMIDTYRSSEY